MGAASGHAFIEARWATFLTEAGFDWEYEPEGMVLDMGDGRTAAYLCDFRVGRPDSAVRVWLEVKPPVNDTDDPRWAALARSSGMLLFTVRGMHRTGDNCNTAHSARVWTPDGTVADVFRLWQAPEYAHAWDAASAARFDGRDQGRRRE